MDIDTFPNIKTPNLLLRELQENDYNDYSNYLDDKEVKNQFFFNFTDEQKKERFDKLIEKYSSKRKPFIWAICYNNKLIGILSLDYNRNNKYAALSYGIIKKYRSRGFMKEATAYLIDYCFEHTDINRIEIAHAVDNIASAYVIESLGAVYEGTLRSSRLSGTEFIDRRLYSILRKEWRNKQEYKENNN